MKGIVFVLGFGLFLSIVAPGSATAQKIIQIKPGAGKTATVKVRVRKFGRIVRLGNKHARGKTRRFKRVRFSAFALPDQRYFPPYYEAKRGWVERPDMKSRIKGGKTVRQGSRYRSHVRAGKTVEGGSVYASHIKGGRTVQGGSRWASKIKGGRSVEQGSQWRSTVPNWRFSGYASPMRPRGIPYYRASRKRSPWRSRL